MNKSSGKRWLFPLPVLVASAVLLGAVAGAWAQGREQAEKDFAFAQGLYQQENYPLAAQKFVAFVQQYPDHANLSLALFRAGECLFRTGKYAEAEPYFARLTTSFPNSAEAEAGWVWLGDSRFQAGKYREAAAAYSGYLQKYPQGEQRGRAGYWLGESYYHLGSFAEAAAAYQQALTGKLSEQEAAYARYALGWTYLQLKEPEKAAAYLQQVLDKHPTSPVAAESQYLLGTAQRLNKNYPAALTAFQKLLTKYPDSKYAALAQSGVAWCYFDQQQYEQALEGFQRVTAAYPQSEPAAEARLRTADCLYYLRRYPAAAAIYEQVAAEPGGKWADEAQYWLAVCYEQMPDREKAIAAHLRLVNDFRQSPRVAESYLHLGRLQLAAGQTEAALSAYQAAAAAAGDSPRKQQALAEAAWARYQHTPGEQALAEVEAQVKQAPQAGWAVELAYQVALAHFVAGRYAPALEMLDLVTTAQPEAVRRAEMLYLSGACQEKLGQRQSAETLYRRALQAGKNSETAGLAAAALVNLYARSGNLEQARKVANDLQKSEAGPEAKAYALYALGDALYQAKQYPEALQVYGKVLTGAPESRAAAFALLGQAWVKLAQGDPGASEAFLGVARKYPQSPAAQQVPEGLLAVAEKLFDEGKYAEAQAGYQRLLEGYPQSNLVDEAQYKLAWSLLKLSQPDQALEHFMRAASQADSHAVAADACYQAARLRAARGDSAGAAALLEVFQNQYQDTETAPAALVLRGRMLTELKQYDQAAATFQAVQKKYPQSKALGEAWLGLARVYREQKRLDQARAALDQAAATAQGAIGAEAQFELAALCRDAGDQAKAAEEFLKVAILYGDAAWSARAQYEAGQCYEALGDKEAAVRCYKVMVRDYSEQEPWRSQAQARLKALGAE